MAIFNIYISSLVLMQTAMLSSTTPDAMPPKFIRKWEIISSFTKFPLPTLLCGGYNVKLEYIRKIYILYFFNFRPSFEVMEIWLSSLVMHLSSPYPLPPTLLADILQYSRGASPQGHPTPECCQHENNGIFVVRQCCQCSGDCGAKVR